MQFSESTATKRATTKPTLWRRIRWWLFTGSMRAPSGRSYSFLVGEPKSGRVRVAFHRLRQLWRVLIHRRNVMPVPITYVMVAGLGLVIGLVLQFTLGFPWWIAPIALVVIAWCVFFSSIWWRRFNRPHSIREEIRRVMNPERAYQEHLAQSEQMLRTTDIPFLWLAGQSFDDLSLGWSSDDERLLSARIHRSHSDSVSVVVFDTVADPQNEHSMRDQARSEIFSQHHRRTVASLPSEMKHPQLRRDIDHDAMHERMMQIEHDANAEFDALEWHPTEITVDGAPFAGEETSSRMSHIVHARVQIDSREYWVFVSAEVGPESVDLESVEMHALVTLLDRETLIRTAIEPMRG